MPHKHAISAYYVIETYCYVCQMMLELSSIALNLSLILDVLAGGPSSAIKVHSDDHRPDCVAAEVVENEPHYTTIRVLEAIWIQKTPLQPRQRTHPERNVVSILSPVTVLSSFVLSMFNLSIFHLHLPVLVMMSSLNLTLYSGVTCTLFIADEGPRTENTILIAMFS